MLTLEQKVKFLKEAIELKKGMLRVFKEEPEKIGFGFKLFISDSKECIENFEYIIEVLEKEKFTVYCRAIGSSIKSSKDSKNKNKTLDSSR